MRRSLKAGLTGTNHHPARKGDSANQSRHFCFSGRAPNQLRKPDEVTRLEALHIICLHKPWATRAKERRVIVKCCPTTALQAIHDKPALDFALPYGTCSQ
jgi:hypothetical protein